MLDVLLLLIRDALFLLGHLSSRSSFPKPLSREEEQQTIARMQTGDEEARHKLIEHNLRLVAHVVRKYSVPGFTQDDLVSVGTLGLCKAVATYKPEGKTPLSTYAARCIENEVLMLLRASKKRRNDVSLSDPIGFDGEGNDLSFADILGTDSDMVEEEVVKRVSLDKVRSLLGTLPRRERIVLEMRFGLIDGVPRPQHEVAKVLHISRSYVSRMEKRAVEMLRVGMECD